MAITRVHPDMVEGTALIDADKATAGGGGTGGDVVQLQSSNDKIHTSYLNTGIEDGDVVLAGDGNHINTLLIDTGTLEGEIVKLGVSGKLPAVDGSLLTSIIEALPAGMPLQTQSTQTALEFFDSLNTDWLSGGGNGTTDKFYQNNVSNLIVTLTPARASSKFRIDVTWSGGLDNGAGNSDESLNRDLGFYLTQVVDIGEGSEATSKLTGTVDGVCHPLIAPVSHNSLATDNATVAKFLLNCSFSYIATPTYTAGEDISYQLGASIITENDTKLYTNRSVKGDNTNQENQRTVSSIIVTEIRGA
tara:strand:+ start:646 stop:1557 length:912 start_codon:yes stop_codon:yes gene_type:complete